MKQTFLLLTWYTSKFACIQLLTALCISLLCPPSHLSCSPRVLMKSRAWPSSSRCSWLAQWHLIQDKAAPWELRSAQRFAAESYQTTCLVKSTWQKHLSKPHLLPSWTYPCTWIYIIILPNSSPSMQFTHCRRKAVSSVSGPMQNRC